MPRLRNGAQNSKRRRRLLQCLGKTQTMPKIIRQLEEEGHEVLASDAGGGVHDAFDNDESPFMTGGGPNGANFAR